MPEPEKFNPNAKVEATHDFRTNKEESGQETMLADLDEHGNMPETITITKKEYDKLKKWEPFELLELDAVNSSLSKEEASRILNLSKREKIKYGIQEELKKLKKVQETKDASGAEKTQEHHKKSKIKPIIISICLITLGAVFGLILAPKKTSETVNSSQNFKIDGRLEAWAETTANFIPKAQKEIIWVCSNPMEFETTLQAIKENTQSSNTRSILITQRLDSKTHQWIAEKYQTLVINLNRNIGNNNWMILDQRIVIDGSSSTITTMANDANGALKLRQYIDRMVKKYENTVMTP